MNYFAHGLRFTDRPYFLVGTAVPDLLSVADRRVRMRERNVMPIMEQAGGTASEVAAGVLRHLHDDRWFHETRAFIETNADLARLFRELLGPEDGFRPGFLGHIVTELLLDAVLIREQPEMLDAYYSAFAEIDPGIVEAAVNSMARHPTSRLAVFLPLFSREQFLRDYVESSRLLFRLNQVMRRIKLNPLPDATVDVLNAGYEIVAARAHELLPADKWA